MSFQLSDPALLRKSSFIDGVWQEGEGRHVTGRESSDGAVVAEVLTTDRAGTEKAIAAADVAMTSWKAQPAKQRAQVLRRWFELMMTHQEDLAQDYDDRAG